MQFFRQRWSEILINGRVEAGCKKTKVVEKRSSRSRNAEFREQDHKMWIDGGENSWIAVEAE